jgi:hypothetical protein
MLLEMISLRWLVAALTLTVAIAPIPANAQSDALKGLTGVNVGVLMDDPIRQQHPDFPDAIQKDVEIKLRVAGLEILSPANLMSKPRLTITISRAGNAFIVTFAFAESAYLERDRAMRVQAVTWLREGFASLLNESDIRRLVKDTADEFLSDWIIANPKKR